MSINDLLPVVSRLSHAEKFRLVQMMLQQPTDEEGIGDTPPPRRARTSTQKASMGGDSHPAKPLMRISLRLAQAGNNE